MCDCYGHKCECCDEVVPMRIEDFNYPRDRFKVWCKKHLQQRDADAVVFRVTKTDPLNEGVKAGWKCAISGPGVELDENCPNLVHLEIFKEDKASERGK